MSSTPERKYSDKLQTALDDGTIELPPDIKTQFEPFSAYRAVTMKEPRPLRREDFNSQIEKGVALDERNWESYSCSCFVNLDELNIAMHLPRKNKKIAKGTIRNDYGAIYCEGSDTHVHWFLYNDCDPSKMFEIIEAEDLLKRS